MQAAIDGILVVFAVALLIPAVIVAMECVLAVLPIRSAPTATDTVRPHPDVVVLIPAHNEASNIFDTVERLIGELGPRDRLLVIADNCSDRTEVLAREAGAEVLERRDPDRRGKGYALSFGIEHLIGDPPDVVVVIDADCRISGGGVGRLAFEAAMSDRPTQANYVFELPPGATALSAVSAFACTIRNCARPLGLHRLGLPCHLAGTGMAFPWHILRDAPPTDSCLVEDLLMGLQLAIVGRPPRFCPDVTVRSALPLIDAAAVRQRRRWEHGHLTMITTWVPRLLKAAFIRRDPVLLCVALDLLVPPLTLLAVSLALVGSLAVSWSLSTGASTAAVLCGIAMAMLATSLAAAWFRVGRSILPLRQVFAIPGYLWWKLPIYAALVVGKIQRSWERTPRDSGSLRTPDRTSSRSRDTGELRPAAVRAHDDCSSPRA